MFNKIFIITAIVCNTFNSCAGGNFAKVFSNEECLRPNGYRGVCKNIYKCEPILNLLIKSKSRPPPWVYDFLRRSQCGFEGKETVVCCPIAVKTKVDHENLNLTIQNPLYEKFLNKSCGAIQILDKVVGGSETIPHEFPWMALIAYKTRFGIDFRCGGSLINHRYVLTAAHCVVHLKNNSPIFVRLGEHDIGKSKSCVNEQECISSAKDFPIEEIIPHPEFYKPELRNDIALIRLAKNVDFHDYIRPICLPIDKDVSERNLEEEKAVVTGWGTTELGISSFVLKKVTLTIIPLSECSEIYKKKIPVTESQICAGGLDKKDSCSGDSGGPLQIMGINFLGEPAYIQHGIVSFGFKKCGTKGYPGVYTKIINYLDWILLTMKD